MGSDLYFFEQCETRKVARRYRKLPEDLPESLRFAHLNPKVAALLASKERGQKVDSEDPFGDGLGKKSLLPDINAAFQNVRNQFDSALSNDEDSQRYLFEEAKLSASAILRQLAQIIYFYEDLHKLIPKSLEYHLMSGYAEFTNDIVVVPREWQTQEMKEQFLAKQQQELNVNSEEDLSETEINMLTGKSKSRLGTERSGSELEKKLNIKKSKGKLGAIEQSDDTESILPKSESRQGKRSESRISVGSTLRHPIEAASLSRMGSRRKGSKKKLCPWIRWRRRVATMANPLSYMQTINFQLSNSAFEDKGWIMLKGRQEEVDQSQILEYCVQRLQESLKSMTAQATKELDQGFDKPVIVRYYGDAKRETLLKYRKSPNKMSPIPGNKPYKPKIPSISDEKNEGKKLMQASHIDGSTVIYYPSGRPAVVYSAAGFGRPGYYTIVYEDGIDPRMLACFTPSGRGVCYYDNGVVRFLSTEKGGHLTELNGKLIRKWKWPQANVKITEPISFQLNNHIMFRCVGQTQMTFVFSCQREMSRFSVGLVPEADEYKPIEETDQLLTAFTFSSKAAKDLMRIFAPSKKNKKRPRKKKDKTGGDTKHDVKKQVSFVEQPAVSTEIGFLPQSPMFNTRRGSVSPGLLHGTRHQSLFPGISLPSERDESDVEDTDSADKTKHLLSNNLHPARTGSISPNMIRQKSSSQMKEQAKSCIGKRLSEVRPASTLGRIQSDQEKTGITKRQSVTPESPTLNSLGREYCKQKRTQSARKPNIKFNQIGHKKLLGKRREKAAEKQEKEEPKISEESHLFIQTEAYTDRWEHKKIADEEARRAEKEAFRQAEKTKRKRRKSVMAKVSVLNIKPKGHSAKSKIVAVDQEYVGKRAQSAQPYMKHSDNSSKGDAQKAGYDQAASVETREPVPRTVVDIECNKKETESEVTGKPKRHVKSDGEMKSEEKSETDEKLQSEIQTSIGGILKPTETSGKIGQNKETETDSKICQKELTDKKAAASYVKNLPEIILETPDGTQEVISEEVQIAKSYDEDSDIVEPLAKPVMLRKRGLSMFQAPTVKKVPGNASEADDSDEPNTKEAEPSIKPGMLRRRGMPMCVGMLDNGEKADEKDGTHSPKGRRQLVVIQSIMAFRRNVLKKKGIILSENEEEEESDEDDSDTQTSKSQSSEILKLLQDFPDKVHYELEADKELARLQRKARNLVDDWMEHYRIAVGLTSMSLLNVKENPNYSIANRNIKSARISDHQLEIRRAVLGVDDHVIPKKKSRIPSAPLDGLGNEYIDEDFQNELSARHGNTGVSFEEKAPAAGDGTMSPTATALISRLAENTGRRSARSRASTSARSMSPARQQTAVSVTDRVPSAPPPVSRSHCPLVIRQQILGYEKPQCRCSRHHIPFILDLELDDFINTETPEGQLIVIMVVSSLKNLKNRTFRVGYDFYVNKEGVACRRVFPGITKAEEMLNEIYSNQNRNRTRPCVQSRGDMFRVFKYDINSAAEMSDHTQPLLMTRHNVVPGMILIYCDGHLYFCDHIFNGYGNTRKDFKKQLMKSRHDAIHGNALPKDFRFSPSRGKSGMRSAWGGEIGGAGVDKYSSTGTVVDGTLQPIHRPNSDSSDGELSAGVHLDAVKEKVDLGPFHKEIQVRLKPLISCRMPSNSRLSSRRPFLPHIENKQITSSPIPQHESISNWISACYPNPSTGSHQSLTTSLTQSS
ncbi:uncharacterized protein LOC123530542 isoform X4 [Mercenaria mercenaria]|uniref:uncharacterized protein LOC123530542 isoform X4 n=1 Tax=Mercenaria mercenaria TaxID=6596 RepID=UPI00234F2ABD|nr:uncharacterized protein LOC123530542 isoform X4 [Mercenaria mercenaria]